MEVPSADVTPALFETETGTSSAGGVHAARIHAAENAIGRAPARQLVQSMMVSRRQHPLRVRHLTHSSDRGNRSAEHALAIHD
jgi:hypothetical protein